MVGRWPWLDCVGGSRQKADLAAAEAFWCWAGRRPKCWAAEMQILWTADRLRRCAVEKALGPLPHSLPPDQLRLSSLHPSWQAWESFFLFCKLWDSYPIAFQSATLVAVSHWHPPSDNVGVANLPPSPQVVSLSPFSLQPACVLSVSWLAHCLPPLSWLGHRLPLLSWVTHCLLPLKWLFLHQPPLSRLEGATLKRSQESGS